MTLTSSPDPQSQGASSYAEIQALPKIDLHRHLEGSIRLETMLEIITEFELDLPSSVEELRPLVQMVEKDERNPSTFLAKFNVIRQFFQSPKIIKRLVDEAIEDAALDGVRVLELRFTPAALCQASELSFEETTDAVLASSLQAAKRNHMMLGLILSINRHESVELAQEAIRIAVDRMGVGIRGVDLAGDEQGFTLDPFIPIFAEAKQAGLKLTIHAGEWGGPEGVAQAIEMMAADRIGHGIRALENPAVVQMARASGVGFEVSPKSNLMTGVSKDMTSYPLSEMIDAGLRVAITTDDPSIFDTTLGQEHALAVERLGLSIETIKGLTLQALQLSFFNEKEQRTMETELVEKLWGSEG
jgi:adenosine deaminase